MYTISELYDLQHTLAKEYLSQFTYPWEALAGIKQMVIALGEQLSKEEYEEVSSQVWIHKSVKVYPSAYIEGPCIVGARSEIRHCAFIRGSALIGEDCVIGNSVELKNVILFDHVQVPHFNYIGDSILGYYAHTGAGAVTSNMKSDKQPVVLHDFIQHENYETGLKKVGAMLGDFVEVGCNSVLNPGTMIGRYSRVYPTSCVRGLVKEKSIWKNDGSVIEQK